MEENTGNNSTRVEIIEAAYVLILENGYAGSSMRQIAQKAGVALGGIYNHFASKEDIFRAVILAKHPYHRILPVLNAARGESAEIFLRDAARRMVIELEKDQNFLNLLFVELVEFKAKHVPEVFEAIFPNLLGFAQRILDHQDELRAIPAPVIVRSFMGLFFSYVLTELMVGKQLPAGGEKPAVDYFVDIYLHGILKDGRSADAMQDSQNMEQP